MQRWNSGNKQRWVSGNRSAAAIVWPGAKTAPTTTYVPDFEYHIHTSKLAGTIVMAALGTCTGYIAAGTNKFHVSTFPGLTTCTSLRAGVKLGAAGLPAGAYIAKADTRTGSTPGNGMTGDYIVKVVGTPNWTASADIGTSGSPIAFTCDHDRIATWPDLRGGADLLAQSAAGGFRLRQDSNGTWCAQADFGAVGQTGNAFASWMRTLIPTGIDCSNLVVEIVGRHINPGTTDMTSNITPVLFSVGAQELGNNNANFSTFLNTQNGHMTPYPADYYNDANFNQLFCGSQLAVYLRACVTDDGVGGAGTASTARSRFCAVNNAVLLETNKGPTGRATGMQGFCLNASAATLGGSGGHFDFYGVRVFINGQFGNRSQAAARLATNLSEIKTHHKVPTITDSFTYLTDSVDTFGMSTYADYLADGSGENTLRFLTDPGHPLALPPWVRVMQYGVAGHGIDVAWNMLYAKGDGGGTGFQTFQYASPLEASHMFGSGHDSVMIALGHNFSAWPSLAEGGLYSRTLTTTNDYGVAGFGDDMWLGDYSGTATVSVVANNVNFTSVTGQTAPIVLGTRIIPDANFQGGLGVVATTPTSPASSVTTFKTLNRQATARTAVVCSYSLKGFKQLSQAMTAQGLKVHICSPIWDGVTRSAAQAALFTHFLNDLTTDAGPLATSSDNSVITVGGVPVFSTSWTGKEGDWYNDLVHVGFIGRWDKYRGGDTGIGVGYYARALVAR